MKRTLLFFAFSILSLLSLAQVVSIRPNYGAKGQTLTTTITVANGVISMGSAPMGMTDVYLQQGATIVYVNSFDPNINLYPGSWPGPYSDSMHVDFTLPLNTPTGPYDVHVISYVMQGWPIPTQVPSDNVLLNGFYVGGNAGTIEGDIYFDINQNGIRDVSEIGLANQRLLISPNNFNAFTDFNGHYSIILDTGTYTVAPIIPPTFSLTSSPSTYTRTIPPSSTGNDFGLFSAAIYYNQIFYVWHHPMRCNGNGYSYIDHRNNGFIAVSGSITLVHSSNLPLASAIPMPNVIAGDTLIWYYNNLLPGQTFHIGSPWFAFTDPGAGQTVWYNTVDSVFDTGGTFLMALPDSFSFVVSCSCDPNEKMVTPQGVSSQHYVPMNSEFNYTVNFQNTGNDTAFTVVILDTLNSNLDLNTFKIIGSSNPVSTQMDANGAVRFTFNNILLPDSNINEPGSHGFVAYNIHSKAGLADPTPITNTAHIFFDLNSDIITNTALSTLSSLQYPAAAFNTVDPTICQSSCISFSNNSTSAASYQWSFPGGNPSSSTNANPGVICYNTQGQYNVRLIVSNALGSDTLTQINYVNVAPSPTGLNATQIGDTLWANSGYTSYQWFYNNDSIQGATGEYYIATANGDYGLVVGNSFGCLAGLNIPNVITQTAELIDSRGTTIYPNPTSGDFEISFSAFGRTSATVEIVNLLGKVQVFSTVQVNPGINKIPFNDNQLPAGVYSLRIRNGNQTIIKQMVVMK